MKTSRKSSIRSSSNEVQFSVCTSSSQGAREYQEDSCGHWYDAACNTLLTVVADGAGGHGGGADASQAAIESSAKTWSQATPDSLENPESFLTNWMHQAHIAVNEASKKIKHSARTTVVGCVLKGNKTYWAHAGDSRLLRFHNGKLVERTRDDSVVQVLFERGEIAEEEMGTHPDQSRLLQSLGGDDPPRPRIGTAAISTNDVFILCTDGFWEHLKQVDLEKLAASKPGNRQKALDTAVQEAVRRGGAKADNASAIMVHCFTCRKRTQWAFVLWALVYFLAGLGGAIIALWLRGELLWPSSSVNTGRAPVESIGYDAPMSPIPQPSTSPKLENTNRAAKEPALSCEKSTNIYEP
jgi:serine/threonine protein phosphatase PrpC